MLNGIKFYGISMIDAPNLLHNRLLLPLLTPFISFSAPVTEASEGDHNQLQQPLEEEERSQADSGEENDSKEEKDIEIERYLSEI